MRFLSLSFTVLLSLFAAIIFTIFIFSPFRKSCIITVQIMRRTAWSYRSLEECSIKPSFVKLKSHVLHISHTSLCWASPQHSSVIDLFSTALLVLLVPVCLGQFASLAADGPERLHPSVHLYVPATFFFGPGWDTEFFAGRGLRRRRSADAAVSWWNTGITGSNPEPQRRPCFWVREKVPDNSVITGNMLPGAQRAALHLIIHRRSEASEHTFSYSLLLWGHTSRAPFSK